MKSVCTKLKAINMMNSVWKKVLLLVWLTVTILLVQKSYYVRKLTEQERKLSSVQHRESSVPSLEYTANEKDSEDPVDYGSEEERMPPISSENSQVNDVTEVRQQITGQNKTKSKSMATEAAAGDQSDRKYHKILYWTPYYRMEDYGFGFGREAFQRKCGADYYCEATNNREEVDSADAVVFHNWHLMKMGLPPRRTPNQLYVFNTMEPPLSDHGFDPSNFHGVFNLTITYRTDSDISTPYCNKQKLTVPRPVNVILSNKRKAVSWFVSDCHTPSLREDYVKELQKYIDVDIYGKCGIADACKKQVKGCMGAIISKYYFYLSFEKILCKDYITEKVMHPYKYGAIPIVRGSGHYDQLIPEHSYIHTDDFKSPKELAEYLHHLMNNTREYIEYFEWKRDYKFVMRPQKMCLLCKFMMNNQNFYKVYDNFTEYWWPKKECELNRFGRNALPATISVLK